MQVTASYAPPVVPPSDRPGVVDAFLRGSHPEDKRAFLDELFELKPDLSLTALKLITHCVNQSSGRQGRQAKMEGLLEVVRVQPDLSDDQVRKICNLVLGSNGPEGYTAKLEAVASMLELQPHLEPEFLGELKLLVDHSQGVGNRRSKLGHVQEMLQRQPDLTPEWLRAVRRFVNESNSEQGREAKLASLTSMLSHNRNLSADQVKSIARAVNANPGLPKRRAVLQAYAEAFKLQPSLDMAGVRGLGAWVNRGATPEQQEEHAELALKMLSRSPDPAAFEQLETAFEGGRGRADAIARAEVAADDFRIAHGLGLPVERLFQLSAPPSHARLPAALLRDDSELALLHHSMLVCHRRIDECDDQLAAPQKELFHCHKDRYEQVLKPFALKWRVAIAASAVGAGLMAAGAGMLLHGLPAATIAAPVAALLAGTLTARWLRKPVDGTIERALRAELRDTRAYWAGQLDQRSQLEPRVRSVVAARPEAQAGAGVHQGEELVVIGGVRVSRRCE